MSVYKCICGFQEDETCKCPRCGCKTESFESPVDKKAKKKQVKVKKAK